MFGRILFKTLQRSLNPFMSSLTKKDVPSSDSISKQIKSLVNKSILNAVILQILSNAMFRRWPFNSASKLSLFTMICPKSFSVRREGRWRFANELIAAPHDFLFLFIDSHVVCIGADLGADKSNAHVGATPLPPSPAFFMYFLLSCFPVKICPPPIPSKIQRQSRTAQHSKFFSEEA